jgi:hypothetical protein
MSRISQKIKKIRVGDGIEDISNSENVCIEIYTEPDNRPRIKVQ